jgi:predicted amidohydrolase YtcJ
MANRGRFITTQLMVLLGLVGAAGLTSAQAPDRIFIGNVVTMVDDGMYAEAVAVRGERIIAVGMREDIVQLADEQTEVRDLGDRALLPGFIDTHGHMLGAGLSELLFADLMPPPMGSVTNMDALVATLRKYAAERPEAPFIRGLGYDDTLLAEMRHPNRHDLDRVTTARPVVIVHISGHLAVGNSKALKMAGVDADTPHPDGGRIVKDPVSGEPTGVMEGNASQLLHRLVPEPTLEEALAGLRRASELWAAAGFTTATDNVTSAALIDGLYRRGVDSGDLFVRLEIWPRTSSLDEARQFPAVISGTDLTDGRHMMTLGPIKLQIDGSPQGYTAHFSQPYTTQRPHDHGAYRGFPYWDDVQAFRETVAALHRDGWQITIHGNGDQGIQDALNAIAMAQRAFPRDDVRHTIQHAQFARPDQLVQMAALNVSASFFIGHTFYWGDRHQQVFLGPGRANHMSPLRSAIDRGVRATLHTDTPVTPIDGIQMIWSAVNRVSTGGNVIGADQRVTALEAVKAITSEAAWQYHHETLKGTIEAGKLADFVVLSDDPMSVAHLDPMKIKDIEVLETILGGETIFSGATRSIVARHFRHTAEH